MYPQHIFCGKIGEIQIIYIFKQEAYGPRLAHLSEIATADMQMLCNIFPILSLQLTKGPSFEQLLVVFLLLFFFFTINGYNSLWSVTI